MSAALRIQTGFRRLALFGSVPLAVLGVALALYGGGIWALSYGDPITLVVRAPDGSKAAALSLPRGLGKTEVQASADRVMAGMVDDLYKRHYSDMTRERFDQRLEEKRDAGLETTANLAWRSYQGPVPNLIGFTRLQNRKLPTMVSPMTSTKQLLAEIDAFLAADGMAATTFGQKAVRNWKIVAHLRNGGTVTLDIADRLRAYMHDNRPKPRRSSSRPAA